MAPNPHKAFDCCSKMNNKRLFLKKWWKSLPLKRQGDTARKLPLWELKSANCGCNVTYFHLSGQDNSLDISMSFFFYRFSLFSYLCMVTVIVHCALLYAAPHYKFIFPGRYHFEQEENTNRHTIDKRFKKGASGWVSVLGAEIACGCCKREVLAVIRQQSHPAFWQKYDWFIAAFEKPVKVSMLVGNLGLSSVCALLFKRSQSWADPTKN